MYRRLLIPVIFIGGLIVLNNYYSLAVTIYAGAAVILSRTIYVLSRKAGRDRIFGLLFWNRILAECEDYSELPEHPITGTGKINDFVYRFGVYIGKEGIFVSNLSSVRKRKILIFWYKIERIEVWRRKGCAIEHATVILKSGNNFKEIILPWCIDYNDVVPSYIGVSGLKKASE
ncbi:hypothetical protein DES49_3105 [Halospina denitrificans]|uniref:Uncharacterized protein n=1 Tax=Halospina denitrificans TaxID=332522 RepID=A0A4R7JFK6_9GAMM|nr:hypothetical protein [Halospina denitrificans]TDT36530.1 hypothetical protein DES49_3105 [Halospina denitrificans]